VPSSAAAASAVTSHPTLPCLCRSRPVPWSWFLLRFVSPPR